MGVLARSAARSVGAGDGTQELGDTDRRPQTIVGEVNLCKTQSKEESSQFFQ